MPLPGARDGKVRRRQNIEQIVLGLSSLCTYQLDTGQSAALIVLYHVLAVTVLFIQK